MEPVVQLIQLTLRAEREMAAQRRPSVVHRDENDQGDEESLRPSTPKQRVEGNVLCYRQSCECA